MPDDKEMVQFEVGCNGDTTEWRVNVKCATGLTEKEFAAALQSLADDIVGGSVSFDTAPEADTDSDLH
jgi:hypothetical protein